MFTAIFLSQTFSHGFEHSRKSLSFLDRPRYNTKNLFSIIVRSLASYLILFLQPSKQCAFNGYVSLLLWLTGHPQLHFADSFLLSPKLRTIFARKLYRLISLKLRLAFLTLWCTVSGTANWHKVTAAQTWVLFSHISRRQFISHMCFDWLYFPLWTPRYHASTASFIELRFSFNHKSLSNYSDEYLSFPIRLHKVFA